MTGLPLLVLRARRGKVLLDTSISIRLRVRNVLVNVAEIDRQRVDPLLRQRLGSCGRFAVHRPQHPVHQ